MSPVPLTVIRAHHIFSLLNNNRRPRLEPELDKDIAYLYVKHQAHREVSLNEYHVSSGRIIVPAGCKNSSLRYCSTSIPLVCAVVCMPEAKLHLHGL